MWNILLGLTGSVAACLQDKLHDRLYDEFADCKVICTDAVQGLATYKRGDVITHIDNVHWASAFVIAPLSANTLAKLTHGLADNEVTCTYRAWDEAKPVIIAPAMNPMMWDKDITREQLEVLGKRGHIIVDPVSKVLPCGDEGVGAMGHIDSIIKATHAALRWHPPIDRTALPRGPGEFGAQRRGYRHTGVDLYCRQYDWVRAVESGTVVSYGQFTGQEGKWNETWAISVQGPSGVVVYGEVIFDPIMRVGERITRGQRIGRVAQVLKDEDPIRSDIRGHSRSMLHIELWPTGTRGFHDWKDDIRDPTPYLKQIYKYHEPK